MSKSQTDLPLRSSDSKRQKHGRDGHRRKTRDDNNGVVKRWSTHELPARVLCSNSTNGYPSKSLDTDVEHKGSDCDTSVKSVQKFTKFGDDHDIPRNSKKGRHWSNKLKQTAKPRNGKKGKTRKVRDWATVNSQSSCPQPFDTSYVHRLVHGPEFKRSALYWLVNPPILPQGLVRHRTINGGKPHVVGNGTFGEVVLATMAIGNHQRNVVIKEPYPEMMTKDKVFEEAKLALYLEPTGYVPLCYGLLKDDLDNHSIVMEYFGFGVTLKQVMSKGKLTRSEWLSVAAQLAEGLCRIHAKDVLLNDIKTDNVLVDLSGNYPIVKYCDLGSSSYRAGISFNCRCSGNFGHLAPEVQAGGFTSLANDVYGLGVLLTRIAVVSRIPELVSLADRCSVARAGDRIDALTVFEFIQAMDIENENVIISNSEDISTPPQTPISSCECSKDSSIQPQTRREFTLGHTTEFTLGHTTAHSYAFFRIMSILFAVISIMLYHVILI